MKLIVCRRKKKSQKNNSSGFSALPGGCRYDNGPFNYLSTTGYWWGDTEFSASTAYGRYLDCDYDALYRYSFSESNGFSVRLVRD